MMGITRNKIIFELSRQWRSVVDDMMDAVSELETDDIWLAWEVSEDEGLWNDMEEVEDLVWGLGPQGSWQNQDFT